MRVMLAIITCRVKHLNALCFYFHSAKLQHLRGMLSTCVLLCQDKSEFVVIFLAYMEKILYLCRKIEERMKSAYKYELADAAGVNYRTFQRWLQGHQDELEGKGVKRSSKLLPPKAVSWICQQYGIDYS